MLFILCQKNFIKKTEFKFISNSFGGIARDNGDCYLGAFVSFLGVSNSFIADLLDVMLVIEFAYEKN